MAPQDTLNEMFQGLVFSTMAFTGNKELAVLKARSVCAVIFSSQMIELAERIMEDKIAKWNKIGGI